MKAAYYSVFYQLLRFAFWVRTRDTQQWTALLWFTFLQFFNVAALYAAVARLLYPYGHRVSIPGIVGFFVVAVYGNYRVLQGNPVFQHPSTIHQQQHRALTAWLVGAYVVLSALIGAYCLKQMHDVNVVFRH